MGANVETRPYIRVLGPLTSIVVGATPTLLFIVPPGRTARLRRLIWYNGQPADVILEIGDGAGIAFVRRIPRLAAITALHDGLDEDECPGWEFGEALDVYAQASAAGVAPANVEVQAEFDLIG
jgi:hypothetical protein